MEIKVRIFKKDGGGGYRYTLVKKYDELVWEPVYSDYFKALNLDLPDEELPAILTDHELLYGVPITGCPLVEVPYEPGTLESIYEN